MIAVRPPTDALVESLVADLRPVPRSAVELRLLAGAAGGAAISMLLLVVVLGARPDLGVVLASARFWSKAAYMIGTAAVSLFVAARLARPGSNRNVLWLLPIPFIAFLPLVIAELIRTNPEDWAPLLLGHGWRLCTWLVLALSVPIYIGIGWAFRTFAPTRLEAAGTVTGLSASAIAGVVYCLHCPTDTALFVLVWYTLAFAAAAILGRLFGRRFLHW